MRALPLLATLALIAATATLALPGASAGGPSGWCTTFLDNGPAGSEECDGHWLCVAPSGSGYAFACGVGVRDPCETAKCHVD